MSYSCRLRSALSASPPRASLRSASGFACDQSIALCRNESSTNPRMARSTTRRLVAVEPRAAGFIRIPGLPRRSSSVSVVDGLNRFASHSVCPAALRAMGNGLHSPTSLWRYAAVGAQETSRFRDLRGHSSVGSTSPRYKGGGGTSFNHPSTSRSATALRHGPTVGSSTQLRPTPTLRLAPFRRHNAAGQMLLEEDRPLRSASRGTRGRSAIGGNRLAFIA